MKRKFICIVLSALFICTLFGCSSTSEISQEETTSINQRDIDGYKYGDFDIYNSYAEDNGLSGTKIYVKGTVDDVYNRSGFMCFNVTSEDNGSWLASFSPGGDTDKPKNLTKGTSVLFFGEYAGFSDVTNTPAILLDYITVYGEKYTSYDFRKDKANTSTSESKVITETTTDTQNNKTIIDENGVKVIYKGKEETEYGTDIKLYIENNSDYDYEIQLRNVSINDYMFEPIFSSLVNSKKKLNDSFTVTTEFIKENQISSIEKIDLSIKAFNWGDRSHDFVSKTVTFEP